MQISPNPELTNQIYQNIRSTVLTEREGLHLSELVLCLRKTYFRRLGLAPETSDETALMFLSGYAYQSMMFPQDHEHTLELDGIRCSPDIDRGIEVKSTRKTQRNFDPSTMSDWHIQILGYMKVLGLVEYDLAVFFVCGNYSPPFPSMECFHIQATTAELDANWAELLDRKARLELALEQEVAPEPNCLPWEMDYCDFIQICMDTHCYRKKILKERTKR